MTKVNEIFMMLACNEDDNRYDVLTYFIRRDCKKMPVYSTEKAIEIIFDHIRHWATAEYKNMFSITPREAMELAVMLEDFHRWEFVD